MSSRVESESVDRGAEPRRVEEPAISGRQLGFLIHLIAYVMIIALLVVAAGIFPAVIVALAWGIGLAAHGLFAVLVPALNSPRWSTDPGTERAQTSPATEAPAARVDLAPSARSEPDRTRALEELSAAIAHEIRNPITAAKSLVQQIAEDPSAPEAAEHARVVISELDRVERSIAHLLRFAREEPFEPALTDLHALVESSVEQVRDRARRAGVRIESDIDRLPSAYVDGEQLRKALGNLLGNALDAVAEQTRGDAFVRVSAGQNLAGSEIWIRVRDNGPGIPEAARAKLFRPFYSSKPGGTGLGLALARKVAARHGGSLELCDHAGQGAEFLLIVPRRVAAGGSP